MEWIEKFKSLNFRNFKRDNLIIMLLVGVLLIVIALPIGNSKETTETQTESNETITDNETSLDEDSQTDDYTARLEAKLEKILNEVEGVGKVKVMITLQSSKELIVEKDTPSESVTTTEEDSEGGTRSTTERTTNESTVYEQGEDQSSTPYVVKELEPEIEGIVVIAEGGDDPVIVNNISDAIMALFGIEVHKIKVMKMN